MVIRILNHLIFDLGYIPLAVPGIRRTVKGQFALTAAVKSHVKSSAVSKAEMFHNSVSTVLSSESSTDRGRPVITGGYDNGYKVVKLQ